MFNDVTVSCQRGHLNNSVGKGKNMLILCLEYQSRSRPCNAILSRHKPFLLVNNSIIQDVYFNAFYCYSRNFRAIKSWSSIYCGSSDIYCGPCIGVTYANR